MRRSVLLLCASCASSPEPTCDFPVVNNSTNTPLFEVGVAYTARIGSGVSIRCPGLEPGARTTLVDEQNRAVNARWTVASAPGQDVSVELSFTPQSQGPYHYAVQFEPNLALRQGELLRGVRRARPPLMTLSVPQILGTCRPAHLTPLGSLICRGQSGTLELIRNGQIVETVGGLLDAIAFAGPVMWARGRWVENDAGLLTQPQGPPPSPPLSNAQVLAATETDGYGSAFDSVVHFSFDGGTWLPPETIPVPRELATIVGDVVENVAPSSMSSDGGAWWWGGAIACLNPVSASGQQRCFDMPARGTFAEPGGVWFAGRGALGVVDEAGVTTSVPFLEGHRVEAGPLLRSDDAFVLAVRDDAGMHYEFLEGDYASGWVEGDRLLMLDRIGHVVVLPR